MLNCKFDFSTDWTKDLVLHYVKKPVTEHVMLVLEKQNSLQKGLKCDTEEKETQKNMILKNYKIKQETSN